MQVIHKESCQSAIGQTTEPRLLRWNRLAQSSFEVVQVKLIYQGDFTVFAHSPMGK